MSILSLRPTYVYLPPVSLHNYHPLVVVSWTQQPNHLNTTTSTPTLPCICLSVCPRGERERESEGGHGIASHIHRQQHTHTCTYCRVPARHMADLTLQLERVSEVALLRSRTLSGSVLARALCMTVVEIFAAIHWTVCGMCSMSGVSYGKILSRLSVSSLQPSTTVK